MKKLLAVGIFGLLMLSSCYQQDSPSLPDKVQQGEVSENLLPLEEAVEIANDFINGISGDATRADRQPVSVEMYADNATRSEDEDALLGYYVMNFGNDEGFAIVSADRRHGPMYAFSDEGSLHISDTTDNPGLRYYMLSLPGGGINPGDLIGPGGPGIPIPDPPIKPIFEVEVAPLLHANVRKWGQEYPFNKYCSNGHVGCVPLSAGMIMSYFEWPTSYGGYTFSWAAMKNDFFNDTLARFLAMLGQPNNLNAHYENEDHTYVFDDELSRNYTRTFNNFGYKNIKIQNFSETTARAAIKGSNGNSPIIITGKNKDRTKSGHAWVLDGIYHVRTIPSSAVVEPGDNKKYDEFYCFHCVWGWFGHNNGYFRFVNGTVKGEPYHTESGETSTALKETYNGLVIYSDFVKK